MKIRLSKVEIIDYPENPYAVIEDAARICYQSDNFKTKNSAKKITQKLIKNGHHTPLEFVNFTINIITDRGIMAELTRHRLISFCIESTRWCSYNKDKFNNELTFIIPSEIELTRYLKQELDNKEVVSFSEIDIDIFKRISKFAKQWIETMQILESTYLELTNNNIKPELARSILPNSLKTEIQFRINLRELRYLLELRSKRNCHPDMRYIIKDMYMQLMLKFSELFKDLDVNLI